MAPSLAKNNSGVFPRGRPPTVDEDGVLKAFLVRGQRCLQELSNVELKKRSGPLYGIGRSQVGPIYLEV